MHQIIQTRPKDASFYLFEALPALLYKPENARFQLPDSLPTEWLESCFVSVVDGVPVARASLYNNPNLHYQGKKVFTIGTYEASNESSYTQILLEHLTTVAKQKGATYLIGQMNGSTWENYRFSLHNDAPNFFLEPYQHAYYNSQFEEAGFETIARYFSSIDKQILHNQPEVLALEANFREMGVTFRSIDMANYETELAKVFLFNSLAFETNFLYSPISEDNFIAKYLPLKAYIQPEFVVMAEDKDKNLIGCIFTFQDFWNKATKTLIVKSISRHPDKQWRGLGHVIGNLICQTAVSNGFKQMIHAFLREEGTSATISKNYSGHVYKQYALYGKTIE